MPSYRIFRMKDHVRQSFRWAAHTLGVANVKPRDYTETDSFIEASSPYAAWIDHQSAESPLEVGDLLQSDSGALYLYKYVGFEEARWVLPEAKPEASASAPQGPASAAAMTA